MELSTIPVAQQSAIPRALRYWVEKWDWECPLLFGLERGDLEEVLSNWPDAFVRDAHRAAMAIQGAFRELLHGASAPRPEKLPSLIGLSLPEAHELFAALEPHLEAALASPPGVAPN